LADPTQRPADLAQTTTLDGRTVDYVVPVEKGVIGPAVYELAALYDPAAEPSPYMPEPDWNGRLVYTFGGGCNVGYHQGVGNGGVVNDLFLSRGYGNENVGGFDVIGNVVPGRVTADQIGIVRGYERGV
jgi:hypothetical protein